MTKWLVGVACILFSCLCSAIASIINSFISKSSNVFVCGFVQNAFQCALQQPCLVYFANPVFGVKNERILLSFFVLFSVVEIVSTFLSLSYISASDSNTIVYSYSVIVALIAHFFDGKPFKKRYLWSALLTFAGATLISKPRFLSDTAPSASDEKDTYLGYVFAVIACLSMSGTAIVAEMFRKTRLWSKLLLPNILSSVFYAVGVYFTSDFETQPICGVKTIFVFCSAVSYLLCQIFYCVGFQNGNCKLLSVVDMSELVMVLVLDRFFLGTKLSSLSVVGVTVIFISVVLVVLFETEDATSHLVHLLKCTRYRLKRIAINLLYLPILTVTLLANMYWKKMK